MGPSSDPLAVVGQRRLEPSGEVAGATLTGYRATVRRRCHLPSTLAHPLVSETCGDSNSFDGGIEVEKDLADYGILVSRPHVVDSATTGFAAFVIQE